jgi:hypothetical protein
MFGPEKAKLSPELDSESRTFEVEEARRVAALAPLLQIRHLREAARQVPVGRHPALA